MSRRKARATPPAERPRRSPVDRLKRRAWLMGLLALGSAAAVFVYNAGHAGQMYLLVRNMTGGPVSEVVVTNPQYRILVDRLTVGEAKGEPIARSADGSYRFHIRYKIGGQLAPEADLRIFGGQKPFEAIELVIEPTGVTSMARDEDEGLPGRLGRGLAALRRRLGF